MPDSTSSKKRWPFWTVLVVVGAAVGVAALLGFRRSAPPATRDTVDTILALGVGQLPVALFYELEPIASLVTIKPDAVTVTLAPPNGFFSGMSYVLAVQTDARIIESAVAASARLAHSLLVTQPDLG
jgi:hypothetical protein